LIYRVQATAGVWTGVSPVLGGRYGNSVWSRMSRCRWFVRNC